MTVPIGDLPDWQTLVTPQIQTAGSVNQGGPSTAILFQSTSPFRIWGAWISLWLVSNAAYGGAVGSVTARLEDAAQSPILAAMACVIAPNQAVTEALAIPVGGLTPSFVIPFYTVQFRLDPTPANTNWLASGGLYISQP